MKPIPDAGRGATTVAARAVCRIAGAAADEVLAAAGSGCGQRTRATAEVRRGAARISLEIALAYPVAIDEVSGRVQEQVAARASELTGLPVTRVPVLVRALVPAVTRRSLS